MRVEMNVGTTYRIPTNVCFRRYNPFEKKLTIKPTTKEETDVVKERRSQLALQL